MKESTSKEKILKNIRAALIEEAEDRFPNLDTESSVYHEPSESLDILFAQNLVNVSGKFVFCENENDFLNQLSQIKTTGKWGTIYCVEEKLKESLAKGQVTFETDLDKMDDNQSVGITSCEYLIARLGSVMVSTGHLKYRRIFIFPTIHVVVGYMSQLVFDLEDALTGIKQRYNGKLPSLITNVTGPSRTADIEKTLILGAHGPKELFVFLIDDLSN